MKRNPFKSNQKQEKRIRWGFVGEGEKKNVEEPLFELFTNFGKTETAEKQNEDKDSLNGINDLSDVPEEAKEEEVIEPHGKIHLDLVNPNSMLKKDITVQQKLPDLDWSLKSTVTLTCPTKPEFLFDESFTSKLSTYVAFGIKMPPSHSLQVARILEKSTKKSVRLNDTETTELNYYKARQAEFMKSFKDLYSQLKGGKIQFFLYVNSLFTVLWSLKDDEITAVISQSSSGFRHLLSENDIPFTAYLESTNQENLELAPGFEFIEEANVKRDGLADTGLQFQNSKSTHLLYNFLLNWVEPRLEIRALGPPILICDSPFLNGTLSPPTVSNPTVISRGSQKLFKAVIKGSILPEVVQGILRSAGDVFEIFMETLPVSVSKCKHTTVSSIEFRDGTYYIKYIR